MERDGYIISDDRERLDLDAICGMLKETYWAGKRTRETIERSIRNSISIGLYAGSTQVGLARWVTDHSTFAWLCDVIIDPEHRSRGLGKWLVECALVHPAIADTRLLLRTKDAHGLYEQFGFEKADCMIRWPKV